MSTVLAVPIAVTSVAGALAWPGRTFPRFFVLRNTVVLPAGRYGWTGIRAGVPFLSRVTAVDGMPVRCAADVYAHVDRLGAGVPVRYTLEQDGRAIERVVPTMRFGSVGNDKAAKGDITSRRFAAAERAVCPAVARRSSARRRHTGVERSRGGDRLMRHMST